MAEKRSSLGSRADSINSSSQPRGGKRRRTMLDSVAEVAKWLLPSWASEHEAIGQMSAGYRVPLSDDQPSGSGASTGSHGRHYSNLRNGGERSSKLARFNNDIAPHSATRRGVIVTRLSSVTLVSPPTTSTDDACDLDDGSDSSTSGCSSLSLAGTNPPTSAEASTPDGVDHRSNDQQRVPNRPNPGRSATLRPPLQTAAAPSTDNSKTRDVSIGAEQIAITAETSAADPSSLNFSLFSRPSRALSSTLNTTLPLAGKHNRLLSSSLQKPERSLNRSIFYDGKTTYGGAAAHRKLNLFSPSPYQMSATRSKAPSNVRVQGQNSSAKRLIQALERINTPVQNAKRIPMGRPDSVASQDSELRRKEALESIASLRQNMPPTLSTCRTPVENAKIGSNVTSAAQHDYTIDVDSDKIPVPPIASSFPLVTSTPSSHHRVSKVIDVPGTDKGGGKIKPTKSIHSNRKGLIPEEEPAPEDPDLVSVPLPIKTLPHFSFSTKPSVVVAAGTEPVSKAGSVRSPLTSLADFSNKPFEKSSVPPVCPGADSPEVFTFAGPVSLAKPTEVSSSKEEEFKFKHPLYLNKGGSIDNTLNKTPSFTIAAPTMIVGNPGSLKVKEIGKTPSPSAELATSGSVLDALSSEKKDKMPSEASDWGSQFRKSPSQWDCPTCFVTNGPNDDKCKACETKNPAITSAAVAQSSASSAAPPNQWGDLFKKVPGSWTCNDCMVSNDSESTSCVACSKPKPVVKLSSGPMPTSSVKPALPFGGVFVMQSGWQCSKCPQRNDIKSVKCAFCEAPKPGQVASSTTAASITTSAFKFGVPSATPNTNATNSNNIPFGQTNTAEKKTEGALAAATLAFKEPSNSAPNEKKGEKKSDDTKEENDNRPTFSTSTKDAAPAIKSGVNDKAPINTAAIMGFGNAFKFGTPNALASKSEEEKSSDNTKAAVPTAGVGGLFTFGVSPTTSASPVTTTTFATSTPVFAFGTSVASSTPATTASSATFSFGSPAVPATITTDTTAPTSTTVTSGTPTSVTVPSASDNNIVKSQTPVAFTACDVSTISATLFGSSSLTTTQATTTATLFGASPSSVATATTTESLTAPISSAFSFTPLNTAAVPTAATQRPPSCSPHETTSQASKPLFSFDTSQSAPLSATPALSTALSTEPTTSKAPSVPASSPFVFGVSNTSSSTPAASSTISASAGYNFEAAANASTPPMFTFGQRAAASSASATPLTSAPGGFGAPAASTATPPASTFGALAASAPTQSATPVFGGGTASSGSVFQFGASAPSTPAVTAAPTPTPSGVPSFVFGQPSTGSQSAANTVAGGPATMFAFGANSAAASTIPGGTNNTNTNTNNGTAPPASATPFGFCATPTMSNLNSSTGGEMFKFTSPAAAPAATTTFQFGAQPPAGLAGTAAPFQFGATTGTPAAPGIPSFIGQSADNPFNGPVISGRKVKRAIRRKPGNSR
ncbi:nuclear pore complex protein Nup153-like [Varroa jacobsoni]|uniref:nuclear pore complex protein Nup153-like n=1 Tax=Varroa jacobsoni TaxID=62625 RepID=UPI000BF5EAF9|nr:nuclear pore complex protein Nup153-like [Varroa jacobsoni]